MSLKHLNKLLAVSIILVLILTSQAAAVQGFRPWAPYQRDEFGGGQRSAEGFYGTLEAVYYTFAPVKNIAIGDVAGTNGVRTAFTGNAIMLQTNTINTNHLGAVDGIGTRVAVGHMRKHFGWEINGYNITGTSTSASMPNASVVINDEHVVTTYTIDFAPDLYIKYIWRDGAGNFEPVERATQFGDGNMGETYSLWGWFIARWDDPDLGQIWNGRLAPLPINFETARVTSKMEHWTVEALCTYRMHPTKFGNFDFFGGVRYMEVDDSLNFYGDGIPWKGVTATYVYGNNTDNNNSSSSNSNSSNNNNGSVTMADANTITDVILDGEAYGVGSILGNSDWRFKAENHIIAPQIGMRYSRTNRRWTLTAEGKFLAGLNNQNLRSRGTFGSFYDYINTEIFPDELLDDTVRDYGIYPWTPAGILNSRRSFNHSGIRHVFSPGVEGKLNANWQISNAVGVQFGVTVMWMDRIARGSRINDYTIFSDGQFFGLNKGRSAESDALMYGFNIGVTVNRF